MAADKQQLKTVLITGGATGIGFTAAKRLKESGHYHVVIIGRRPNIVEKAVGDLGGASDSLSYQICDLRNENEIETTVKKIVSTHRGIYGLINNAGVYPFGDLNSTSSKQWDDALNINLKAPFLMVKAVTEPMSKSPDGGRIVNIASTAGITPNHFAMAYSVAKAGLIAFTRTVAKEVGKKGITVNCICPGIVRTDMHSAYHQSEADLEEFYGRRGKEYPMGRIGKPEDIAQAIEFFIHPQTSWITGEIMVVDGGRLLL